MNTDTANKSVLTPIEQKRIDELHELLTKMAGTPNILTLSEFMYFSPLYTPDTVESRLPKNDKTLRDLSDELMARIDYYKPTHVIRSKEDPTVILRLPQLLTPFRTMSSTEKNTQAINRNYAHRGSGFPRIWSTAQNQMTAALFAEQNAPEQIAVIARTTKETSEIMEEFGAVYGSTNKSPGEIKESAKDESPLEAASFEDL